ncbi:hypothetical protein, partial [Enterobacter roggenkampii]|uniref:hypothetical protein n=2 Tax=Enterobacter roggenkampii TaxID=1812935 RepID=UPI001B864282
GLWSGSPPDTRGRSPVRKSRTPGSVRGVSGNGYPYRDAFFAKFAVYTSMGYSWFFPILLHTTYVSINTRLKIRKRIDMKEINKIMLIFCREPVNLK